MPTIRRVLISVTDKTGIIDFARGLTELGAEIISTGGTARMISESGVPVQDVAAVTAFPEMLDGRVKTLHPAIAAGILAIRGRSEHMQAIAAQGIAPIDMVVVNLYRFEEVAAKPGARLEPSASRLQRSARFRKTRRDTPFKWRRAVMEPLLHLCLCELIADS